MTGQAPYPKIQCRIRPLQGNGRTREPHIEVEISELLLCPASTLRHRSQQKDRNAPDYIREETLVFLIREYFRNGDGQRAGDLAEALLERSAGFVHRQIAVWKSLTPGQKEDCVADSYSQMMQDLFNLSESAEFWEVRFWLCLKRRIQNCVQKYRTVNESEFQPNPLEDGEGHSADSLEMLAAPEAMSPQHHIEIREALALLPDKERMVFVLYHYEDWNQEEIARRLKITDRTVRNILGRVEKRLAGWRAGIQGDR